MRARGRPEAHGVSLRPRCPRLSRYAGNIYRGYGERKRLATGASRRRGWICLIYRTAGSRSLDRLVRHPLGSLVNGVRQKQRQPIAQDIVRIERASGKAKDSTAQVVPLAPLPQEARGEYTTGCYLRTWVTLPVNLQLP